jgi:hypothetical protein
MGRLRLSISVLLVVFFASLFALAGTAGSFRGKVVESEQTAVNPNWIYVQGRNGAIRRVEISKAKIEYDEGVPAANRNPKPQQALTSGTEVRVTAEQGKDGEWRASRVEILDSGESKGSAKAQAPLGKS